MTAANERKDRAIAGLITLLITSGLLLFLIIYKIITPLPPFEMPEDGGMEINFGTYNEGTGNVENNGIGEATSVVVENSAAKKEDETPAADQTFENGEPVLEKTNPNPKIVNNTTVIKPQKTKEEIEKEQEDANAAKLLSLANKNKNKGQSGGDGSSGNAGNEGSPDGNPNTDGMGGSGNNPNNMGHGNGPGGGGNGPGIAGRKLVSPPPKVSDAKEEGIVVVYITVDKNGNVTDADPNGKGTTTSSGVLKSKARQAALQAKFSASDKYDTQRGSLTFKFQF